jgi:hypothetical protein
MSALRKHETSHWQPALRLVRDEEHDEAADGWRMADYRRRPLAIQKDERRMFPRRETTQAVVGRRLDHSVVARRQPVLELSLRDVSVGGLSAVTGTPLTPGERIAVAFPPEGLRLGWDARGRVIRCEPTMDGYRVAVEFESTPSAA